MEENMLSEIYKLLNLESSLTIKELVEKKKNEFNISSNLALAKLVGMDKNTLQRIIDGDTQKVDLFSILKISQFLGLKIDELVQVYVSSLKPEFIGELESARKANYIVRNFDINGLKDAGFIEDKSDIKKIEKRIVSFFNLNSIFEYDSEVSSVLFSRSNGLSHDKMRELWVRSAYFQFKKINNPNDYDKESLELLIPKIRSYTRHETKGLLTVIQALYNVGVTVICQKYLTKTQVMGGTFVVNNKPCIVLTDYNKKYPIIWTALMHELFHVLYDFEDLKTWKYHLSGESDMMLMREEDANFFAREILFPEAKMEYIKHLMNSPVIVMDFAEKHKIHPSFIYQFYCMDQKAENGKNLFGLYSDHIPSSKKVMNTILTNPWDKENIFEEIEIIKSKLTV